MLTARPRRTAITAMKIFYVALICYLFGAPIFAQSSTPEPRPSPLDQQVASLKLDVPRIREIMKLVATNKDQPSKQIHDEFWGLVLTRIHDDPAALQGVFTKEVNDGLLVQIAFWESLRLSAQTHRVTVTPEFARMRDNYAKAQFTSDYTKVQDAMLHAASSGQPYTFRNGQKSYISVQVAESNLAGMNATKARLDKLCDPNW